MFRNRNSLLVLLALLAQSASPVVAESVPDHPTWQEGLKILASKKEISNNPVVQNGIKAKIEGVAAAQKIFDAAEFLKKSEEFDVAEPFYREAWREALRAAGPKDANVEKYGKAYANFVLNEKSGSRDLYWAHSEEERHKSYLQSADSWEKSAQEREKWAKGDRDRLQDAANCRRDAQQYRDDASNALKDAAKYREQAKKAVAEASRRPLFDRAFSEGRNAYLYHRGFQYSEDLLVIYLNHLLYTKGPDADLAKVYETLAEMKLKEKSNKQAVEYFRKAIKAGAIAWSPDSAQVLSIVSKFHNAFPEEAGSVPPLLQAAKQTVEESNRARGVEKYRLKVGEIKSISSGIAIVFDYSEGVKCIVGKNVGKNANDKNTMGFRLLKSATFYDDGKKIKITFRGIRSKTVVTCYPEHHPIDADIDVERTTEAAPKVQLQPISKVIKDGLPDFHIGGTEPAYTISLNPLCIAYPDSAVYGAPGRRMNFITNYGVMKVELPAKVGDSIKGISGPVEVSIARIPNPTKMEANLVFKISCRPVAMAIEPKIASINF